MKKLKALLVLVICGFVYSAFFISLTFAAWDKDVPSATTSLRASNPLILGNNSALQTALDYDHDFDDTTQTGKHEQVTLDDPLGAAPGTVAENEGIIYLLDAGGKAELHFEDEDENTIPMTSAGSLGSATTALLANTATFAGAITANSSITLGAGDDLIGSSTSDITFNTDKFTVAGATGDTTVGGTFESVGIATLADASVTKTTAAPAADAQIANKKYVDDQITATVAGSGFWKVDGSSINDGGANPITSTWEAIATGLSNTAICLFKVQNNSGGDNTIQCKSPDDSGTAADWDIAGTATGGPSAIRIGASEYGYLVAPCDASGDTHFACGSSIDVDIWLVGYIE